MPQSAAAGAAARTRDPRIDALRGIAIALIVVQHLGWAYLSYHPGPGLFPTFIGTWTASGPLEGFWLDAMALSGPFCVGLFAFVSGYLVLSALRRPFGAFLRGRLLTLVLPYLAWQVVYWLDPQTDRFFLYKGSLLKFAVSALASPTGTEHGPVWFLFVLFLGAMVVYFVSRLPRTDVALTLSALAALVLPRVLARLGVPAITMLNEFNVVYPYLVAGLLVSRAGLRWSGRHQGCCLFSFSWAMASRTPS